MLGSARLYIQPPTHLYSITFCSRPRQRRLSRHPYLTKVREREKSIRKYRTCNTKKSTFKDTMKTRAFLRLVLYSIERVRWVIGKCKQKKALKTEKKIITLIAFSKTCERTFLVCRSDICNKKGYCIFLDRKVVCKKSRSYLKRWKKFLSPFRGRQTDIHCVL